MKPSKEEKGNAETPGSQRQRREEDSFVGERFDAGKFASGKEF
jgi:hypothetical protein